MPEPFDTMLLNCRTPPLQLVNQKVIANTFGLCFGYPNGGKMLLGDVRLEDADKMQYTSLHPGQQAHYYTTILQRILCDDVDIGVPSVRGAR